jgi:transcriptional regulator with XRE-family HTH domain
MSSLPDWLQANHLTDAEFARRIGVSRVTVGRYCRGERHPHAHILVRIHRATHGEVSADSMHAMWIAANRPENSVSGFAPRKSRRAA